MNPTSFSFLFGSSGNIILPGDAIYTVPGTYVFDIPPNVDKICAVCIGSGANTTASNEAGGGGALAFVNNYSVRNLDKLYVYVAQSNDGYYSFVSTAPMIGTEEPEFAFAFVAAASAVGKNGGNSLNCIGDFKYSGGNGNYGGGSAGGWTSSGVNGSMGGDIGLNGVGGSGASGGGGSPRSGDETERCGGGAGGTGLVSGSNGVASLTYWNGGGGGSGGTSGTNGSTTLPGSGGNYGGGAGGFEFTNTDIVVDGVGGVGAVRLMWGEGRSFPSTNVGILS